MMAPQFRRTLPGNQKGYELLIRGLTENVATAIGWFDELQDGPE